MSKKSAFLSVLRFLANVVVINSSIGPPEFALKRTTPPSNGEEQ